MKTRLDWKDVATSYYEKSITLAVLFMLFSFMVTPEIQVKPYEGTREVAIEAYEEIPDFKEKIKPPVETKTPVIDIVIEDIPGEEEEEELEILTTIKTTTFDMTEEVAPPPSDDAPSKFVVYDEPPVAIRQVSAEYSSFAKRANIEGTVVLEFVVKLDGTVGQVDVIESLMSGPGGLDEAAVNAVKQWEFQPAKSNGKPVAVWVTFPVSFKLRN